MFIEGSFTKSIPSIRAEIKYRIPTYQEFNELKELYKTRIFESKEYQEFKDSGYDPKYLDNFRDLISDLMPPDVAFKLLAVEQIAEQVLPVDVSKKLEVLDEKNLSLLDTLVGIYDRWIQEKLDEIDTNISRALADVDWQLFTRKVFLDPHPVLELEFDDTELTIMLPTNKETKKISKILYNDPFTKQANTLISILNRSNDEAFVEVALMLNTIVQAFDSVFNPLIIPRIIALYKINDKTLSNDVEQRFEELRNLNYLEIYFIAKLLNDIYEQISFFRNEDSIYNNTATTPIIE